MCYREVISENVEHFQPYLKENGAKVAGVRDSQKYIIESKFHQNQKYTSVCLIGEFEVPLEGNDMFTEGQRITDLIKVGKKTLNYQIYVYDKEGPIPHFHIIETTENNRNKRMDTCICIFRPMYFDHGIHTSSLSSKELKILNEFLSLKYNDKNSYWDLIVSAWDLSNPDNYAKYPRERLTKTQPDYTQISGFVSNPKGYI